MFDPSNLPPNFLVLRKKVIYFSHPSSATVIPNCIEQTKIHIWTCARIINHKINVALSRCRAGANFIGTTINPFARQRKRSSFYIFSCKRKYHTMYYTSHHLIYREGTYIIIYPFTLHKKLCHDRDGERLVRYTVTDKRIFHICRHILYILRYLYKNQK